MRIVVRMFCGAVGVLLYLNTLRGELVFDDRAAIEENKDVLPSSPWSNLLWHDFWGDSLAHHKSHKSYRPLASASFKLNYHLHQLNVAGYHLVNIILNGLVCHLFVQVCELVFTGRAWSSSLAGLLFACHPIHTEAVASVVGRTEVLCSVFFLLSLLAYHKAAISLNGLQGFKWLAISMLFSLCSFLSKEQGITAMAACILYELFIILKMNLHSSVCLLKSITSHPKKISSAQKIFLVRVVVVSMFVLAIAICRIKLMHGVPKFSRSDNPGQSLPAPYRQLYYLHLVYINLWLLLDPTHLVHDWRFGFVPLMDSLHYVHHLSTLLTFALLIMFTYYCILRWHKGGNSDAPAAFGYTLMIVTFLPASNFFFLVGFVVAERVLFLPSMGFCIIVAFGVTKIITYSKSPFVKTAAKMMTIFLLFSHSIKTVNRNSKWLCGRSLYIEALKLNKHDGLMYSNLGYSFEDSHPEMAEEAHRLAVQLAPNFSQPFRNYGALLMRQKRYTEAEQMFHRAIEILGAKERARSRSVETYQSLAYVISRNESRIPEALGVLEVALSMKPGMLELLNMKGYFLHMMNKSYESVAVLRHVVSSHPDYVESLYHLGVAHYKLGEKDKAEELMRRVLQLDTTNGRAMLHLGLLLAKKDPPNRDILLEAGKYLKSVVLADPSQTDALYGLGLAYSKLSKYSQAEQQYLRVLELDPLHQDALLDLAYLHYTLTNFTEVIKLLRRLPQSMLFSTQEFVQLGSMLLNSHIKLDQWKEGEELFKIMLAQDSQKLKVDALNGLGELRLKVGELLEAKQYFTRTLEIDQGNQLAADRIRKLNTLLQL